ncbi:unnamed protein product [Penicillium olsonii]|nr:unnamed protein product [Penicillium olsonii]
MPFSAKFNKFKEKLKSKTGSEKQGKGVAPTETSETPDVTPTPPEPSVHSSVSDPIPISSNDNTEPWARAYEIVVSREPDLMEVYARHLASLQGETAENTDLSLPRSVESAMEQLVKIREEKQWRLSILGKDVKIREQVERLAKFVLWSEPIVTKALSAQPYAALGWSGVTLLLPLFVSGLESSEAMLQGFNSLADVQLYWHICETRYLNGQHVQVYKELFEPLAKLYSYIIEFHACAICHLSKSQTSRALKGMTDSNDWKGKVTTIDELSTKCSKMIPRLEVGEVREERDKVLQEMQQSQDILNEIRSLLQTESKQSQTIHKEQKTKDLLRDLISDHTPEDYKDFNPERVKGTCEWFFKDERFCEWRAATSSSILWVSASPGCGKSVLARALIDESRLSTSVTTSTVCYFFFKDGPEHRMQATDALSVILHQIFTKHPEKRLMIQHGLSRHAELGSGLTKNFSALWNIFVKCVESPNAGEIVVVLDALDECKRTSWLQLLEKLNKTYCDWHLSGNPPKLKFLITSRPYDDLKRDFKKFSEEPSYVPFEGDDKSTEISEEINLVIDARVKEIAKDFKEDDRHMIADRLKSMKNRTYLWLHLTFDIIDQSPCQYGRRAAVVELLSDLPAEVSDAYEKILERSKDSIQTTTLLEIVLVAARPLTLDEANLALTYLYQRKGVPLTPSSKRRYSRRQISHPS